MAKRDTGGGADAGARVTRRRYDWSSVLPSTGVLEAVAAAADRTVRDLPPLFAAVDPDALDDAVRSLAEADRNGALTFDYAGFSVRVDGTGLVAVRPAG
ncbi:HalOD1 output domain-containing protein [Halobacterium yunchengense]|uniref:HalOD1 output domain-containing protein n=1 Tax=Halobacterium yunchengense TaxID=3108497 RepID=UPI0030096C95